MSLVNCKVCANNHLIGNMRGCDGTFHLTCFAPIPIPVAKQTNSEKIRAMSDEELAEFLLLKLPSCPNLCTDQSCVMMGECKHNHGVGFLSNWLKSEVST